MIESDVHERAAHLLDRCRQAGLKLTTAESCTGGLLSAALTDIAGSSDVFDRGFVTYSNDAKMDMLGVSETILTSHGAVSEETVRAMAVGALSESGADLAVAVTGIAGPGGGSDDKPVGLVHIAAAHRSGDIVHQKNLFGDIGRSAIRHASLIKALDLVESLL